ncbi:hypothetical protein ABFS82_09G126300 [Erythranthe guttata]|uniref:DNA N(6)-methyladenine demethylase n=1 Tax=Erythranthe guttata TaxID=4155 RepID=A0A022PY71_ERYGU|nr:PREDICTED: uncharacterized protein LOC105976070 [Erythranthe guttata]EYU21292.1 hypothetical protein MIMGU_mgv1a006814mg [Erythranthe guttata]|eukprot:XP_012856810.1 PREDICTED: uncharacterized protein LOC105976070 [Erythranthe guttata]
MNRGRGGNRGGGGGGGGGRYVPRGRSSQSADRHSPIGAHSNESSPGNGSGSSRSETRNSEVAAVDNVTKKFSDMSSSDYQQGPNSEPRGVKTASPNDGNPRRVQNIAPGFDNDFPSLSTESAQTIDCSFMNGKLPKEVESGKSTSDGTSGKSGFENSDSQQKGCSFDICEQRDRNVVKLKTPLHVKNKAARNEMKRRTEGYNNIQNLRPGMILLKNYLSVSDQVKLIKACRDLGRGCGGFYQPGYSDGAKLQLKMMCLGKNWDPETSTYGDKRPIDEAEPPPIPVEFQHLVKEAIRYCHSHLESHSKEKSPRDILPSMSPNICIINFYTKNGKLGLHQDKDESQESLSKGLPVVSFSIGDSAEFLFGGDQRDIDKAEKVVLESGDVLIFGGESRHIFHGVSNIIRDTAPKALLEETDFRPGRLNLTFREY